MNDPNPAVMEQVAPYPDILHEIVANLKYRPRWRIYLDDIDRGQGSRGLTFIVTTRGFDTYHVEDGENYGVYHYFIVPAAAYNRESWLAWCLDCLIKVETHEACEFFQVGEERPFAPHHGPGWDPYTVFIHGTDEAVRTSFRGVVKEG